MSSFSTKIECLHQDLRSKRAAAVISAAKALGQQRLQVGLVGAVSPTPLAFIDKILADEALVRAVDCLPRPCTMLDLGSGDGRWLQAFAGRFPQSLCYGVELDDQQLKKCRHLSSNCGGGSSVIELVKCDFAHFPCQGFGVIILYMSRLGNELLQRKLEKECDAGTLLVVVGFEMRGWSALKTFRCTSSHLVAYLYVVGSR
jgi:hypothetical protein